MVVARRQRLAWSSVMHRRLATTDTDDGCLVHGSVSPVFELLSDDLVCEIGRLYAHKQSPFKLHFHTDATERLPWFQDFAGVPRV